MRNFTTSAKFIFGFIFCFSYLILGVCLAQNDLQSLENERQTYKIEGNKKGECQTLLQISQQYELQSQASKALQKADEALKIARNLGNKALLIQSLEKVGLIYSNRGGYGKALIYYKESLKISRNAVSPAQLSHKLLIIAKLSIYNQQKIEAVQYFEEAYKQAQKTGNNIKIYGIAEELEKTYKNLGNTQKSLEYQVIKSEVAKQMQTQETKQIADDAQQIGAGYQRQLANQQFQIFNMQGYLETAEARRRDAERVSREKDLVLNQQRLLGQAKDNKLKIKSLEIDRQTSKAEHERNIRYAYGSGAILMGFLGIIAFYYVRVARRKSKETIFLLKQLEGKQKDITDSIAYAKRIQDAILPSKTYINELFPENFVFFKPKDIVSGDFYWAGQKNGIKFIVASDCTGHGVPGAFMSMLGISLINSIVLHRGITSPNIILDELGDAIIATLRQENKSQGKSGSKDGMDIAFCALDEQNDELHFSGAFNSLLMVRSNIYGDTAIVNNKSIEADKVKSDNFHLYQLKANRQPVGIHRKKLEPFILHTLKLIRGDTIYIFSDGFVDQFGGEHNRKFMSKNFKKLLSNIQYMGMTEQHIKLKQELSRWQGDYPQVDDICVIGFKY